MLKLHVTRFVLMYPSDFLFPKDAAAHDVVFLGTMDAVAALARQVKGNPCDAANLVRRVNLGVQTLALAIRQVGDAAWLAKVHTAG